MVGEIPFRSILIVGGGLIGSSLLRAVRSRWAEEVSLYVLDKDIEVVSYCVEHNLVDEGFTLSEIRARGLKDRLGLDLVVLAVPLGAYKETLELLSELLFLDNLVVSDVGSSKRRVCDLFSQSLPSSCFGVPCHPVAGIEKSGPQSGMEDLFLNRHCVVTPYDVGGGSLSVSGYESSVERVESFWRGLGMSVERMTAEHHDLVLAMTSHLPTLIAYCLTGTAKTMEDIDWNEECFADGRLIKDGFGGIETIEVIRYAAGGFRDFTRIAASDSVMWRDVFLTNKSPVLYVLDLFLKDLEELRNAVNEGDGVVLQKRFARSQEIRKDIVDMGQAGQFIATEISSQEGKPEEKP